MKDKIKEIIRSVPITDKTYSEYIEAVAERLIAEDYRKIYDDHERQCICYALGCQMAEGLKRKVAEEIFAEIKKRLDMYSHIHRYAEEANKVTEEYADGSPVEMTSVWDACRLEHNGYDDYEMMCKLQDNIVYIGKSRLLKEFEVDIAELKKKYTEENNNDHRTN